MGVASVIYSRLLSKFNLKVQLIISCLFLFSTGNVFLHEINGVFFFYETVYLWQLEMCS